MAEDDRSKNIEMFLSQLSLCVEGLRERDTEKALAKAEVHCAFLYLAEDTEFAGKFKKRWNEVYAERNSDPWVEKPLDTVPDLVQCFIITLTEYMGLE